MTPAESISVYPDALGWCYSVRHGNGGDIRHAPSEKEAWKQAREVLAWHRAHPFGPTRSRVP